MPTEELLESYSFGELLALRDMFKQNVDVFYTEGSLLEKQVDAMIEQLKPKQDQLESVGHDLRGSDRALSSTTAVSTRSSP